VHFYVVPGLFFQNGHYRRLPNRTTIRRKAPQATAMKKGSPSSVNCIEIIDVHTIGLCHSERGFIRRAISGYAAITGAGFAVSRKLRPGSAGVGAGESPEVNSGQLQPVKIVWI
jgi:hypothetical protein